MVSGRAAIYDKAVVVPAHVLVREVAGEMVLLSLESEDYFGLDPVGSRIWQLLVSEATVQGVLTSMLEEYEVDEATLGRDLEALVEELSSRHLIELVDPPVGSPS